MRVVLSFVLGVLVGAGALFAYLRQVAHDTPPPAVAGATPTPTPTPAPGPAPAAAPGAGPAALESQLPPAPLDEPRLTSADLAVRPDPAQALEQVPALAPDAPPLAQGKLLVPVEGVKASQLTDTFDQARGKGRRHEALDIMAPRGTRVLAAADGKLVKLFTSKAGGLTVYEFDPTSTYVYYYAHLERYADGLKEGMPLKRGDLVGYVGSTGDASPDAPHLHFAVFKLTPEKQWWKGTAVDPFPLLVD